MLPTDAFQPRDVPTKPEPAKSNLTSLLSTPPQTRKNTMTDEECQQIVNFDEDFLCSGPAPCMTPGDIFETILRYDESGERCITLKTKETRTSLRRSASNLRLMAAEEDGTIIDYLPEFCQSSDIGRAGLDNFVITNESSTPYLHVRLESKSDLAAFESSEGLHRSNSESYLVQCRVNNTQEWLVAGEIIVEDSPSITSNSKFLGNSRNNNNNLYIENEYYDRRAFPERNSLPPNGFYPDIKSPSPDCYSEEYAPYLLSNHPVLVLSAEAENELRRNFSKRMKEESVCGQCIIS